MFVFRKQDLPADPVFPADLEKLGYFINDKDQIRKRSNPAEEFVYKINKNDRWNEVQRGAMNECIRTIVIARLRALGLVTICLPLTSGPTKPHVPILVSKNLSSASRIIIFFGEPVQDLGILAYRTIGSENINAGSVVDIAKAVLYPDESSKNGNANGASTSQKSQGDTAIILTNTGQLVWHCGTGQAMTINSWLYLPRPSAVDPPHAESRRNKIPGNGNWQEHVESVFEGIFKARGQLVRKDARIDVIGAAEGGLGAVKYLAANWNKWRPYISAICLATPLHTLAGDISEACSHNSARTNDNDIPINDSAENINVPETSFRSFLATRVRAYDLSFDPLGVLLPGDKIHGCKIYSSGEELNAECIMPAVWKDMLKWLDKAWADPAFGEAQIVVREFKVGVDGVEVQEGDVGGSGSVEVNAKDAEKVEEDGKRRDAGYMDQMENVKPNAEDQNTAKEEESGVFDDMV